MKKIMTYFHFVPEFNFRWAVEERSGDGFTVSIVYHIGFLMIRKCFVDTERVSQVLEATEAQVQAARLPGEKVGDKPPTLH